MSIQKFNSWIGFRSNEIVTNCSIQNFEYLQCTALDRNVKYHCMHVSDM